MRSLTIFSLFAASLAWGDWTDYEETRDLELNGDGISEIRIFSRAGSLEVTGASNADRISVVAIIQVPTSNEEKARKTIEKRLTLGLEKRGEVAELKGYFEDDGWSWNDSPAVRLEVSVPSRMSVIVDDSSGSIKIRDTRGDVRIDDSSGSIEMENVGGSVDIEDGSGSIRVEGVGGDISIEDGSGSITVAGVEGSVWLDDGSGSITVKDVGQDLVIENDGSGSLNYEDVQGTVRDNS